MRIRELIERLSEIEAASCSVPVDAEREDGEVVEPVCSNPQVYFHVGSNHLVVETADPHYVEPVGEFPRLADRPTDAQ